MSDTVEFVYKKDHVFFVFTVKKEFMTICPNPNDYTTHELNTKFSLKKYLHCLTGPAAWSPLVSDKVGYWIDGQLYADEKNWKVGIHSYNFKIKLANSLKD